MITAGTARHPYLGRFVRAGFEVFGAQGIETAAGNFELVSRLGGTEPQFPKTIQHVTNEGRRMSVEQLLVLFKSGGCRRTALRTSHFVGPCLCLKTMPGRSTTASKRRHHKTGEDKPSVPKGIIFPHHPAALHQSKRPITQMRKPFFRHQPKLDKLTSFLGRGPKQKRSVFGRRGARAKAQSSPPCSFTLYRSPKDHLSPKAKTTEPSANKPFGSPALLTTESVLLCSPRDMKKFGC